VSERTEYLAALNTTFRNLINDKIAELQDEMMEDDDDVGMAFDIWRSAHAALSWHLGHIEGLLEDQMLRHGVPVAKLREQRTSLETEGRKEAEQHVQDVAVEGAN
jgi:hypothetical protein